MKFHPHPSHPGYGWVVPISGPDDPLIADWIAEDIIVHMASRLDWMIEELIPDTRGTLTPECREQLIREAMEQ